jgi:8-oxo-dGTP pyrophosphatase MutT (NUDIX family)
VLPSLPVLQGLIDEGETPAQAALRELKEECGYVGEVTSVSPYLAMSPGMTNESIKLVTVNVDLNLPANQTPKQELDEGEFCEVLKVPTASLLEELVAFDKAGVKVFTGLWCLAHGMSMSVAAAAK